MTRHPAVTSTLVAASILVGLGHGCTAILDIPEEVTGYRWCLDAEPARGQRADNLQLVSIKYAVSNNWTRACKCYCAADHQIMLQGADGELAPGSEDALWYELQVGQLRASATTECEERAAELAAENATTISFVAPGTVSCLDAVADEAAYFAEECVQFDDVCPPGAAGGFGTDGYIPGSGSATSSGDGTADDSVGTIDGTGALDTSDSTVDDGTGTSSTSGGVGVFGPDDVADRGSRTRPQTAAR